MLLAALLLVAYGCSKSEVIDGQIQDPSQVEFSASNLAYTFTNICTNIKVFNQHTCKILEQSHCLHYEGD